MTPEEAIKALKLEGGVEITGKPKRIYEFFEALDVATEAIKEIQQYREMNRELRKVYGDCDVILETAIDGLCRHSGVDIGNPIKARLLTDEDVDRWDDYRAIGTVEECREAVERQKPKKCVEDSYPDHTHYKCPLCGQIQLSTYTYARGIHRLGRITKHCENCGQALINEDSEGMKDE